MFVAGGFVLELQPSVLLTRRNFQRADRCDAAAPIRSIRKFGLRYAYFPSRYFGIEGEGTIIAAGLQGTTGSEQIYGVTLQALFQIPARVTPFIGLGGGLAHGSSDVLGSEDSTGSTSMQAVASGSTRRARSRFDSMAGICAAPRLNRRTR